jgi:hypothetical protein
LTDPASVLRAGLVPYWCPAPTRQHVDDLQRWIAGSQPYASIEALPEPPGTLRFDVATPTAWTAAVAFGQRHARVDPRCRRAYPLGSVPPCHAAAVLRTHPCDLPRPHPMAPARAHRPRQRRRHSDGHQFGARPMNPRIRV